MERMHENREEISFNQQVEGFAKGRRCETACTLESWSCPICMDLLYKPCVNNCGHTFCFWCMHNSMNPFRPSQCPLCRAAYTHFPRVCVPLHYFLASAFPEQYAERARENKELEAKQRVESPDIPLLASGESSFSPAPSGFRPLPPSPPPASSSVQPLQPAGEAGVAPVAVAASGSDAAAAASSVVSYGGGDEHVALPYRCSNPCCGRLAYQPCVLSCGCLVCKSCAPGAPGAGSLQGTACGRSTSSETSLLGAPSPPQALLLRQQLDTDMASPLQAPQPLLSASQPSPSQPPSPPPPSTPQFRDQQGPQGQQQGRQQQTEKQQTGPSSSHATMTQQPKWPNRSHCDDCSDGSSSSNAPQDEHPLAPQQKHYQQQQQQHQYQQHQQQQQPQCPSCGLSTTPDPRVCGKLEEALRCLYPDIYRRQQKEQEEMKGANADAVADVDATASIRKAGDPSGSSSCCCCDDGGGGGADIGNGCDADDLSKRQQLQQQQTPQHAGAGASSSSSSRAASNSSNRWERPRSKLPRIDALIAAAAMGSSSSPSGGGGAGGGSGGGGGSASGPSTSDIWLALREEMASQADSCFTWYSVGCDDCGVFPIIGRRYRCLECRETIGYDLCGACYDRGTSARGRFNQAHRPEHRMVKVEPCFGQAMAAARRGGAGAGGGGGSGSTIAPQQAEAAAGIAAAAAGMLGDGPGSGAMLEGVQLLTLMNYLEVLHPELTVEQATMLVIMHLGAEALDLESGWTPGGARGVGGRPAAADRSAGGGAANHGQSRGVGFSAGWRTFTSGRSDGGGAARAAAAAAAGISGTARGAGHGNRSGGGGGSSSSSRWGGSGSGGGGLLSWLSLASRRNGGSGGGGVDLRRDAFTALPNVVRSGGASRDGQQHQPLRAAPPENEDNLQPVETRHEPIHSDRSSGSRSSRNGSNSSGSSCCVQ